MQSWQNASIIRGYCEIRWLSTLIFLHISVKFCVAENVIKQIVKIRTIEWALVLKSAN